MQVRWITLRSTCARKRGRRTTDGERLIVKRAPPVASVKAREIPAQSRTRETIYAVNSPKCVLQSEKLGNLSTLLGFFSYIIFFLKMQINIFKEVMKINYILFEKNTL